MYNINVDVAAILHLIGTALLHAYRNIYVSVPATLEATEGDLTDVVSIVGKCESEHCAPTQEELDSLNRDFQTVRRDEAALDLAAPWGFRAIKKAFLVKARAKRMKVHAMRIATNARFRGLFKGVTRTLTRTATALGPLIGIPLPQADTAPKAEPPSGRSSESTLRNPPASPTATALAAADLLASKRAAPPCSCAALISQLNTSGDMPALIAALSKGIVDAQTKAPTSGDTSCHPNEAALTQLIVALLRAQAAHPLGDKTVPQAPELALVQDLVTLFSSIPSNVALPTIPVAVACR
ncbi:hypothetical protein DFH09DRAFT_1368743 [Mycena vulgaris]|nr:hypothetical protein DFH09DRAFT_1368743 [Mycena vulgaris]